MSKFREDELEDKSLGSLGIRDEECTENVESEDSSSTTDISEVDAEVNKYVIIIIFTFHRTCCFTFVPIF